MRGLLVKTSPSLDIFDASLSMRTLPFFRKKHLAAARRSAKVLKTWRAKKCFIFRRFHHR
jgi:hypothetical protein